MLTLLKQTILHPYVLFVFNILCSTILLISLNHFSRLLEECITRSINGTQLYRPYKPMI